MPRSTNQLVDGIDHGELASLGILDLFTKSGQGDNPVGRLGV
jgi:hypothetical protein